MTEITTHVLDTAEGRPAAGVAVSLHARGSSGDWRTIGSARTDADGRARGLAGSDGAGAGVHRLVFDTGGYLETSSAPPFFSEVVITFRVADEEHLHIPLLLSPFGYSVYRGS